MGYRFLGETQELGDEWTWIQGHGCEDCGPECSIPSKSSINKDGNCLPFIFFNELIDYVI